MGLLLSLSHIHQKRLLQAVDDKIIEPSIPYTYLSYVSSKAIYKYLYSMYGQAYCRYLKSHRYGRRKRKGINAKRQLIPVRVFIDQRPEIINAKERYGDWEVDRVESNRCSKAGLLVVQERKARYYNAVKTMGRTSHENKGAIKKALHPFATLYSLTFVSYHTVQFMGVSINRWVS